MVFRNHNGVVRLAAQYIQDPVILESDCARVLCAVQNGEDRSELSFLVAEAIEQTQMLREWKIVQVKREREKPSCKRVSTFCEKDNTFCSLVRDGACVHGISNCQ